jgi:hypothetical protein
MLKLIAHAHAGAHAQMAIVKVLTKFRNQGFLKSFKLINTS